MEGALRDLVLVLLLPASMSSLPITVHSQKAKLNPATIQMVRKIHIDLCCWLRRCDDDILYSREANCRDGSKRIQTHQSTRDENADHRFQGNMGGLIIGVSSPLCVGLCFYIVYSLLYSLHLSYILLHLFTFLKFSILIFQVFFFCRFYTFKEEFKNKKGPLVMTTFF